MIPRDLPEHARTAFSVLRLGLGKEPFAGFRIHRGMEPELLSWLTATGLGSAYLKALDRAVSIRHSGGFLDGLKALRHGALARNMVLFAELARIHDAAKGAGIEFIPLKGVPAIVRLFGGDIAMRPMADLDLMVRPRQVGAFRSLLVELGYGEESMPIDPFVGERGIHAPPYVHPGRRAMVEVHRAADYRFRYTGASLMPDFFRGADKAVIDGRDALLPSWPAWILQWAVHMAYIDAYVGKTRDLYDMAVLLDSVASDVDWAEVIHPRRTSYLLRPLFMGALLVEKIFGASLPAPWGGRLAKMGGSSYPARELAEWFIRKSLFEGTLQRTVPISFMAAASKPLHVPAWTPIFVGEFLRIFVAPPVSELARQYGRRPGPVSTPFLYLKRTVHLAAVIANRLGKKVIARIR